MLKRGKSLGLEVRDESRGDVKITLVPTIYSTLKGMRKRG
jgi:hypothetical protein